MKICFISCIESADDTRAARILGTLSEAGHEVVALMGPPDHPNFHQNGTRYVLLPPVTKHFWPDSSLFELVCASLMRARNSLAALYRALHEHPDLCICQEPDAWLVGFLVALFTRAALVVDLQEIYEVKANSFPRLFRNVVRRGIRGTMRVLSRHSDFIIHVSETRKDYYSYLTTPSIVVPHFPLLKDFAIEVPPRDPDLAGRFVVIHAGTLRPHYAAAELLRAIDRASLVVPDLLCLVLGGEAGVEGECSVLSRKLKDEGKLRVLPSLSFPEVVRYLKMADVGINLVSKIDLNHTLAFPRKLFEYMAAGLPIIGSDVVDICRIITREQVGYVVDAAVPDEIADAIVRLAENPEDRARMATNARQAAERTYNWSRSATGLKQLFTELEHPRQQTSPS